MVCCASRRVGSPGSWVTVPRGCPGWRSGGRLSLLAGLRVVCQRLVRALAESQRSVARARPLSAQRLHPQRPLAPKTTPAGSLILHNECSYPSLSPPSAPIFYFPPLPSPPRGRNPVLSGLIDRGVECYQACACTWIVIRWQLFGSSGQMRRAGQLVVLLQVRLRQRQVVLHHLHRRVSQHHLQTPQILALCKNWIFLAGTLTYCLNGDPKDQFLV